MDDVILTTCTDEGTSNPRHVIEVDNEEGSKIDNDPIQEFEPDGSEITLFSKPKVVSTEPEESGSNGGGLDNAGRTYPGSTTYVPPPHMLNVDLDVEGGLEFPKLTHRRSNYASSSLNVDDLQVERSFPPKMFLLL